MDKGLVKGVVGAVISIGLLYGTIWLASKAWKKGQS